MVEGNMPQLYEVNGKQRRVEGRVSCELPSSHSLPLRRGVICVCVLHEQSLLSSMFLWIFCT